MSCVALCLSRGRQRCSPLLLRTAQRQRQRQLAAASDRRAIITSTSHATATTATATTATATTATATSATDGSTHSPVQSHYSRLQSTHTPLHQEQISTALSHTSRQEIFDVLKRSGWSAAGWSPAQLSSVLDAISPSGRPFVPLRHVEIRDLLQWLHGAQGKNINADHVAVLDQIIDVIKRSIRVLPLPTQNSSPASFSSLEAQERGLFVSAVRGLQNLVSVDGGIDKNVFTQHLLEILAILFERKKVIQEAKPKRFGANSTPGASPTVVSMSGQHMDGRALLGHAQLLRTRRVRSKILFASSPQTPFSEYILNCFTASNQQKVGRDRYSPAGMDSFRHLGGASPPAVSGFDIKSVLSGLHRVNSDHEEVRDLLKMVAEEWIPNCSMDLTSHEVSLCFSGLQRMRSSHHQVRLVVMALTSSLMNCFETFSALEMSRLVSGVQICEANHPELQRRLITVIMSKLRYCSTLSSGDENLTVPLFSRAVAGLRNVDSQNAEGSRLLKRLLRYLHSKAGSSVLQFSPYDVSLCLNGVRNFNTSDKPVQTLLQTMASGVIYSNDSQWTTSVVCDLLGQMGNLSLSSREAEVCSLLAAVTNKLRVAISINPITDREIGQAMCSLRHMNSDSPEVLALLGVLSEALEGDGTSGNLACSPPPLSSLSAITWCRGKSFGDTLRGLRNISAQCPEIDRFLSAFSEHLIKVSKPLCPEEVSLLLLQLRHVKVQSDASRHLVNALTATVERCRGQPFTSRQVALSFFGLSELSNEHSESKRLIGAVDTYILRKSAKLLGDDVCLALYGLKNCTHSHREIQAAMNSLKHKVYTNYAKPTQPWADYERMLPARHAGMLSDVLSHQSNPAFSMHGLVTAMEGLRGLSSSLRRSVVSEVNDAEELQLTRKRVQQLQATLLTKFKYTDAPLNLTHLSMFLNALRFNSSEFYLDKLETNALKLLAFKCVTKLYVTPADDYQDQIGFVLYHLRRYNVKYHWNKVILLNSVFPQLDQAGEPLDYVNLMHVLHLLINSKVDHDSCHIRNSTSDALKHVAWHLEWTLKTQYRQTASGQRRAWSIDQITEMRSLLNRIRRSRPYAPSIVDNVRHLLDEFASYADEESY